jgi:hypothetical protein
LIRKNVEPQEAVTASRARVAGAPARSRVIA